jgi:hypothetical protein
MPKKIIAFFLIFVIFSWAGTFSLSADNEESSEARVILNRLGKTWAIQDKEIATAHIVYRSARGDRGINTIKSLTNEQVDLIVSQIDFSSPEKAFNELAANLLNLDHDFITSNELYCTVPTKYIHKSKISERNRKNDTLNLRFHTKLFDGTRMILVDPFNKQVDVYVPKGGVGDPLYPFRAVPRPELLSDKFHCFLEGENIKIEYNENEDGWLCHYLIDIETGLTIDNFAHHTKTKSIGRGRYQRCFFSANSINFPRLTIQVAYENYHQILTEIVYIEEMSFNVSIPEKVYQLALPKGMRVYDATETQHRPIFTDVQEPIDNINTILLPTEKSSESLLAIYIKRFCIFTGVVLLVIGLLLKIRTMFTKK